VHFSLKIWHLVATILIISSIVKRLLWRARPLAGGQILFRGRPPVPPSTGAGVGFPMSPRWTSRHSLSGRFFHNRGLAAEKLLSPNLLVLDWRRPDLGLGFEAVWSSSSNTCHQIHRWCLLLHLLHEWARHNKCTPADKTVINLTTQSCKWSHLYTST